MLQREGRGHRPSSDANADGTADDLGSYAPDALASVPPESASRLRPVLWRCGRNALANCRRSQTSGAGIGFIAVSMPEARTCIIRTSLRRSRWRHRTQPLMLDCCRQRFPLPVKVLCRLFRAKFTNYLRRLSSRRRLAPRLRRGFARSAEGEAGYFRRNHWMPLPHPRIHPTAAEQFVTMREKA